MAGGHEAPVARRYVVVGASGILAPLGALLRGPGTETIGISRGRRRHAGEWDRRLAVDATDPAEMARLRAQLGPAYRAIGYAPALTPQSWAILGAAATAQMLVVTSSWAVPDASVEQRRWKLQAACSLLQLGWTGSRAAARWHTPDEIADAAFRLLHGESGTRMVLGRLRPWSERPHESDERL